MRCLLFPMLLLLLLIRKQAEDGADGLEVDRGTSQIIEDVHAYFDL